jgi:hypothetical protein
MSSHGITTNRLDEECDAIATPQFRSNETMSSHGITTNRLDEECDAIATPGSILGLSQCQATK